MSTVVMSACWPLQIPPVAKAVLISLADNANDSGYCWPSIDTISERTCYGRTAVIEAVKWLESAGYLVADRSNGRKTTYFVTVTNRSATRTGTADEPVRNADQTSPPRGRDQSATRTKPVRHADTNRQEPSSNRHRTVNRPEEVPEQVWEDFIAVRKAKRAPITQTALAGIRREAEKVGMTLAEALGECCERTWQTFRASWWMKDQARPVAAGPPKSRYGQVIAELTGRARKTEDYIDVEPEIRRIG